MFILNRLAGAPPNLKGPASVSSLTNFLAIGQRPLQRSESESGFLRSGMTVQLDLRDPTSVSITTILHHLRSEQLDKHM